jgi:hypothetical protein
MVCIPPSKIASQIWILTGLSPKDVATWKQIYPTAGTGTVTDVIGSPNITIAGISTVTPQVVLNDNVTLAGFLRADTITADNGLDVTLGGVTIDAGGLTVTLGGIDSIGQTRLRDLTNGVVLSSGTGVLSSSQAVMAGQVLMSAAPGNPPTWQPSPGGGTVLDVTGDANITIAGTPASHPQVTLNPSVTITGTLQAAKLISTTNGIDSTGTTILRSLNHIGTMMTDGTGQVSSMAPGTDNQVLTSLAGAISWRDVPAITYPITIAHGGTNSVATPTTNAPMYFDGTSIIGLPYGAGTSGLFLKSNSPAAPTWAAGGGGGSGTVTQVTATAPLVATPGVAGNATYDIALPSANNGQLLIGGSSPEWALGNITPGNGITISNANHAITITSSATFPCNTGTATPNAAGTLNVYGGAAIKTTGSGNTITIDDTLTMNNQVASYALLITDAGKFITVNNAAANTVTIPLAPGVNWVVGTQIVIQQLGAGQTSIVAAGGVTIRSAGGRLKLTEQYSMAALVYIALNVWSLGGDITL